MSLTRAFTKRAKRPSDLPEPLPGRAVARKQGQSINRSLISPPVELLSTTNMLSYNAPDIPNATLRSSPSTSSASSVASKRSVESTPELTMSSPDLTDSSSVDSPSPVSPKPNHLSSYFASANPIGIKAPPTIPLPPVPALPPMPATPVTRPRRSSSTTSLGALPNSKEQSPAIPQRSRTHSKHAHEQIARQRSMHSLSSTPRGSQEYRTSREQRSSTDMFRIVPDDPAHPFGPELEQLKEVVEEFGGVIADAEMDEDIIFMRSHGLAKFSAVDYLSEIQPLFGGPFAPMLDRRVIPDAYGWI